MASSNSARGVIPPRPLAKSPRMMPMIHKPQIRLHDHQASHYMSIYNLLAKDRMYIDVSEMGSGKTIVAIKLSMALGLPLLIICAKMSIETWVEQIAKYSANYKDILNFEKLTGQGSRDSSPYVTLVKKEGSGKTKIKYEVTPAFEDITATGVLLIIDEAHHCKNNSLTNSACSAMTRHIQTMRRTRSRIGLLSATLFDKIECIPYIFRATGLVNRKPFKAGKDYRGVKGYNLSSLSTLITYILGVNPYTAQEIMNRYGIEQSHLALTTVTPNDVNHFLYDVYMEIGRDRFVFRMPKRSCNIPYDIKEGYYNTCEEDQAIASMVVNDVEKMIEGEGSGQMKVKRIDKVIELYETSLLNVLERKCIDVLLMPCHKVIILMQRIENMNTLHRRLLFTAPSKSYTTSYPKGIAFITGTYPQTQCERNKIISKFQEPNEEIRVLIMTMSLAKESISLHDTDGGYPRHTFVTPDFNLISLYQSTGRTYRVGLKSSPECRIVLSKQYPIIHLLRRLYHKSSFLRDNLPIDSSVTVEYPDNLPKEIEQDEQASSTTTDPSHDRLPEIR